MMSSDSDPEKRGRLLKPHDFLMKYKTELCRNWEEGRCEYGEKCAFAHGSCELRPKTHVTSAYKTKNCKQFFEQGYCIYGARCQFKHSDEQGTVTSAELAIILAKNLQDLKVHRLPVFVELQERGEKGEVSNVN